MPEIAEVEVTRRAVNEVLPLTVEKILVSEHAHPSVATLQGVRIEALDRVGKWLTARTEVGVLVIHLGMSGAILLDTEPRKHTHVLLRGVSDNGDAHTLGYDDPRRFGRFFVSEGGVEAQLGLDLWDENLNGAYLHTKARGRKVAVKTFLLNQSIVAGIGSYLVDEGCFKAGVDPVRPAGSLSETEWAAVLDGVVCVSLTSLAAGGATFQDFRRPDGQSGEGASSFAVYGRGGQECLRCGTYLTSTVVGGRSVVKCERCQV